jgi:Holliday junction resolvase RusA-like endonuclease
MRKLTIKGSVPSLKNQKQIFVNKRTGKPFITSSQASKVWTEDALWQLKGQKPITEYPVTVAMTFYFKGKHSKDLDNCTTSVLDVLVTAGILEDDDCFHVDNLEISFGGIDKEDARVEVVIVEA